MLERFVAGVELVEQLAQRGGDEQRHAEHVQHVPQRMHEPVRHGQGDQVANGQAEHHAVRGGASEGCKVQVGGARAHALSGAYMGAS